MKPSAVATGMTPGSMLDESRRHRDYEKVQRVRFENGVLSICLIDNRVVYIPRENILDWTEYP